VTITKRAAAIAAAHRAQGQPSPFQSRAIAAVLAGLRRTRGVRPQRRAQAPELGIRNRADRGPLSRVYVSRSRCRPWASHASVASWPGLNKGAGKNRVTSRKRRVSRQCAAAGRPDRRFLPLRRPPSPPRPATQGEGSVLTLGPGSAWNGNFVYLGGS
jgi:hypothetical protein